MVALRTRLFRNPLAWLVLVVLALGLRATVPQGMMVGEGEDLTLTVSICRDAGTGPASVQLQIPRKAPQPGDDDGQNQHCAFGALGHAATMPPIDLLVTMLAFVMALALLPAPRIVLHQLGRLRPPLRGPPTTS